MSTKTKSDATAQIRERAYTLWKQEGCPEGRAWDHWLAAEAQVTTGTNGADATKASRTGRAATKAEAATKNAAAQTTPARKATARKTTTKAVRKKRNGK